MLPIKMSSDCLHMPRFPLQALITQINDLKLAPAVEGVAAVCVVEYCKEASFKQPSEMQPSRFLSFIDEMLTKLKASRAFK